MSLVNPDSGPTQYFAQMSKEKPNEIETFLVGGCPDIPLNPLMLISQKVDFNIGLPQSWLRACNTHMVYSHCTGIGPGLVHGSNGNLYTGPRQGQGPVPTVSY